MTRVRADRAEAAKLRARAERINQGGLPLVRPTDRQDPLLAAAGLAVEDLTGAWESAELGKLLGIRDKSRIVRLLAALRDMGHVEHVGDGRWRSADPVAAQVRDAVIELGEFTTQGLADHLGMHPTTLRWYLADLRQRHVITGESHERMAYNPPGRETVVTRRRHAPTPEQELIDQAPVRGHVVELTGRPMVETGSNRRQAGRRKSRGGAVRKKKQRGST